MSYFEYVCDSEVVNIRVMNQEESDRFSALCPLGSRNRRVFWMFLDIVGKIKLLGISHK
jgi:hypothetical protein